MTAKKKANRVYLAVGDRRDQKPQPYAQPEFGDHTDEGGIPASDITNGIIAIKIYTYGDSPDEMGVSVTATTQKRADEVWARVTQKLWTFKGIFDD